ncbi:unnamed protein product [Rotaria socialis]|uniref:F-box domain-containing protein n=1 Tax=Rotaria socialis TaxID=392032 RepID=A0A817T5K7_9BILA|nr:unnamed protein product [Rotaria socialis]
MSILDLSDEMLLCILNKSNNINVLYSLVDINKFTLGQPSIERLLHIVDYLQLYSLSLVFCQPEIILNYLIGGDTVLVRLVNKQITHFNLKTELRTTELFDRYEPTLFALILSFAKCLTDFTFVQCLRDASPNSLLTLFSTSATSYYHEFVPLFRRMSNLAELTLFLFVKGINSTYIDGIHLNDEILVRMPRLNKFTFSITTRVCNRRSNIFLPSNDDIQRSFIERKYQQIGSYADDNTIKIRARCHIYSLPYQFRMFHNVTNSFQGGMFNKVRSVIVTDDIYPFEHEFFQIISQSFPFLQTLSIQNDKPQKSKKNSITFITFSHLAVLNLELAHIDYVEQFLFERKTCLLHLTIQ